MPGQLSEETKDKSKSRETRSCPEEIKVPLVQLQESANSIWEILKNCDAGYDSKLLALTLNEILTCQMRFITGVYTSIFLQKDYDNEFIDSRMFNYFKGLYNSYNEFIGLNEDISSFLKGEKYQEKCDDDDEKLFFINLFRVNFKTLKLKTPPISDNDDGLATAHHINFGKQVMAVMRRVLSSFVFLNDLTIELNLRHSCHDNLLIFQHTAESLLKKQAVPKNPKEKFEQWTGDCYLCINDTNKLRLDPIIIPLKSKERSLRLASLTRFFGRQTEDRNDILYHELDGNGISFNTNDSKLFKKLYHKKGLVSEHPTFSRQYKMPLSALQLQLYIGDIFDLNFLKTDGKKMAMVNLLNRDLSCKTPLSMSLETLNGPDFLYDIETQNKGNPLLDKNKLYITRINKKEKLLESNTSASFECGGADSIDEGLKFEYFFHCPIYDIDEKQDQNLKSIENIIKLILEACIKEQIEILIVPAMGSFWAGQIRRKVAEAWYKNIKTSNALKKSNLKKIIFSFINEETCTEYHKFFRRRTGEQFKGYHLPVYSMYNNIASSSSVDVRIDKTLDLCSYLYCFMSAWAIRALMWEKIRARNKGESFELKAPQKTFVKELCKNAGLLRSDQSVWSKGISLGRWRDLSELGYQSTVCKEMAWSFAKWYKNSKKSNKAILNDFLSGGGRYDYPALRNTRAHAIWHSTHTEEQIDLSEDPVIKIEEIIRNMPFIETDRNKMAQVKRFSVMEDTNEVKIDYITLGGSQTHSEFDKKPNSTKEGLDGQLFELDAVYLIENIADNSVKVLNLHPFLLYGRCRTCQKQRLYVWRDFIIDNEGSLKIEYGSTGCHCKLPEDNTIAGYDKNDLSKRFSTILKGLKNDL